MKISNKWMKAASDFFGNARKTSAHLTSVAQDVEVVDPTVIKTPDSFEASENEKYSVEQITAVVQMINSTNMNISVREVLEADHILQFMLRERLKSFHIHTTTGNLNVSDETIDMDIAS